MVRLAIDPPSPNPTELRVHLQQHPNGAIDLELRGAVGLSLHREVEPSVRQQAEVGIYDGWSDEEERIFLAEEADPSNERTRVVMKEKRDLVVAGNADGGA